MAVTWTSGGVSCLAWPAGSGLNPVPEGLRPLLTPLQVFLEGKGPFPAGIPVDLEQMPPFRRCVLQALQLTEVGETLTYGVLAARAGHPGAARAVGQAMRTNPVPILVPCHRVVGRGWTGGYSFGGGLEAKSRLLELEAALGAKP